MTTYENLFSNKTERMFSKMNVIFFFYKSRTSKYIFIDFDYVSAYVYVMFMKKEIRLDCKMLFSYELCELGLQNNTIELEKAQTGIRTDR